MRRSTAAVLYEYRYDYLLPLRIFICSTKGWGDNEQNSASRLYELRAFTILKNKNPVPQHNTQDKYFNRTSHIFQILTKTNNSQKIGTIDILNAKISIFSSFQNPQSRNQPKKTRILAVSGLPPCKEFSWNLIQPSKPLKMFCKACKAQKTR